MTTKNNNVQYYIYDMDKKCQFLGTLGERFDSEEDAFKIINKFYDGYIHLDVRKVRKGMYLYQKAAEDGIK